MLTPKVSHIGRHPKNWLSGIPTVQGEAAGTSETVAFFVDAVTSVTVLAKPAVPGDVITAAEGLVCSAAEFLPTLLLSLSGTAHCVLVHWPICIVRSTGCPVFHRVKATLCLQVFHM